LPEFKEGAGARRNWNKDLLQIQQYEKQDTSRRGRVKEGSKEGEYG
jgi:hypothetical protein